MAWFTVFALPSWAQERPQLKRPGDDIPEEKPPEKKKLKKGKEPRAVGILEFNSSGKGTLVPVAILVDGKFYDASAYKADPVPMALESGTVYEAEVGGESQGLFTISGARHSKGAGVNLWVGEGTYLPKGTEAPKTTRKAENVPVGISSSGGDEPPRLTRKDASKPGAGSDPGPGNGSSGSGEKPSGATPASSQAPNSSSTASNSGREPVKGATQPAAEKPADASAKHPAPAGQAGSEAGTNGSAATESGAGETTSGKSASDKTLSGNDRPQLRRGKPTAPLPSGEEETAPANKVGGGRADSPTAASTGPLRMVAAISDAAGPDPQTYKYFWKTGEEEERRNQMLALATAEVEAYAARLAQNQIAARPSAPKATAGTHKLQAKPAAPVLENVQFRGFDLWLTNQPVMMLSAEAHIAAMPGISPAAGGQYSVLLVARTDIYGNLRKLYAGVTDKFHMDVTPRLELMDAVDADGDGRGELLFRETTDAGSGYVIYRATADRLWKMFDSLNAE
jgi:hypothetical protein